MAGAVGLLMLLCAWSYGPKECWSALVLLELFQIMASSDETAGFHQGPYASHGVAT